MSLAGWDAGQTTTSTHSLTMEEDWGTNSAKEDKSKAPLDITNTNAKTRFLNFIRNFKEDNIYSYRDQLRRNYTLLQYFLEVNFIDLNSFDEELANLLLEYPNQLLPFFEEAAGEASKLVQVWREDDDVPYIGGVEQQHLRPQVIIKSTQKPIFIRDLHSEHIGKLVVIPGIIISASRVHAKAVYLQIVCRFCGNKKNITASGGFSSTPLPAVCDSQKLHESTENDASLPPSGQSKCGPNPYIVLGDYCEYVDQQSLKLQESPEDVPTGEMPRHLMLSVDRRLVSIAPPGSRVIAVGVYSVAHSSATRLGETGCENVYLQIVGLQVNEDAEGKSTQLFSRKDEQLFQEISRRPNIYQQISSSIAPAIYGHDDIKKAIACLLMGGSKKYLPDGIRLRGDINVLLLGDPGTAKSQFLKFVERVAPIGVYTSGKGSSAAGLTASVVRDSATKEYYLEGGAMVLADGGVVCIDEFDKMHTHDRVAIHEAMEQQTISIAKAGITTTLNARTSVLAAANPVFGSYDDLRSPTENIEFQTTILSRFDMIFVVRDDRNESKDKMIADHVMKVHMNLNREKLEGEIDVNTLKRYIAYCRQRCHPCLAHTAAEILRSHYVNIRSSVHSRDASAKQSAIPITVRQLEAIIRITEALAKMSLSPVANETHVNEAIRLFKVSTLEAALSGSTGSETVSPEMMEEVNTAETLLKKRLPVGSRIAMKYLLYEMEYKQKLSRFSVQKAISILAQRDEVQFRNQRKTLVRIR